MKSIEKLKKSIAAAELKEMLPCILLFNAAALAAGTALGFVFGFDWRIYTGFAVGNALMAANFLLIGVTCEKIAKCRNFKRGRFLGNFSYGLRYIGIFAVLAVMLMFELISPVAAIIPLFYPKIYYTFFYARMRGKDEES